MKENKENKENKEVENLVLNVGCAIGTGAACGEIVKEVKSLDLDSLSTVTKTGNPTGHGNMFENCVKRENPGSVKINNPGSSSNRLLREKNGVDIQFSDGTNVQCKCCRTSEGVVKHLMEDGEFRYPGQTIAVVKGQGKCVEKLLREHGVNEAVIESKYTYEQVKEMTKRGWESAKFDVTNPAIIKPALFLASVIAIWVLIYEQMNKPKKAWWKKTLKAACFAVGTFVVTEVAVVGFGQLKRR